MSKQKSKSYFHKHGAQVLEFYISGNIGSPNHYVEWYDAIRHAGKDDEVKIYLNSGGGDLAASLQFSYASLNAPNLRSTNALSIYNALSNL